MTKYAKASGCAAKIGPGTLAKILGRLPKFENDRVLVGLETGDDAAVYKINDDVAMIQTLDFFPPIVDDPYMFGQIAAANALSDIYAMGGQPAVALNIVAFPKTLDISILGEILKGGADKVREAGAVLVGGIFEGTLGLMARYWRRLISPIVSSIVVTTIGFSLLGIGIRSFGGGYNDGYGSADNLFLGTVTLVTCLLFSSFAKGYYKQLAVLVGLVVGYVLALGMGKVDLSAVFNGSVISLPVLLPAGMTSRSLYTVMRKESSWYPALITWARVLQARQSRT